MSDPWLPRFNGTGVDAGEETCSLQTVVFMPGERPSLRAATFKDLRCVWDALCDADREWLTGEQPGTMRESIDARLALIRERDEAIRERDEAIRERDAALAALKALAAVMDAFKESEIREKEV